MYLLVLFISRNLMISDILTICSPNWTAALGNIIMFAQIAFVLPFLSYFLSIIYI